MWTSRLSVVPFSIVILAHICRNVKIFFITTPLQSIKDNYEKVILTLDHMTPGDYEGIKVVHLLDWLLEKYCTAI